MGTDDRACLHDGAARMGITLTPAQETSLLHYLALLLKWNKVYNLISRRANDNLLALHLLDSLSVLPYINGPSVVDVGSGAGLPGIPLAIMSPDCHFTLLDSNSKKGGFRTQAVIELGLKNITVVSARAEEFRPEQGFDQVISRAFATITDMLAVAGHLATPSGRFLAMKGLYPHDELAELAELAKTAPTYRLDTVHELKVPDLGAERHLAIVARVAD